MGEGAEYVPYGEVLGGWKAGVSRLFACLFIVIVVWGGVGASDSCAERQMPDCEGSCLHAKGRGSSPGRPPVFAMLHFLAGVEYTGAHYILL